MPDIEVPNPDDVSEQAENPFTKMVALAVAVYAVVLAICSLGGSNAGEDMMMAQQKASNQWNYYQAKVQRENLYLLEAEKLDLELEVRGANLSAAEKARIEQVRDKFRDKAKAYKQDKDEIMAEAKKEEADRDTALRRDPYFDAAEVCLQIAIVLASVAMLSGKKWAFYASAGLAILGALLTANGFGLFVTIPGLEG